MKNATYQAIRAMKQARNKGENRTPIATEMYLPNHSGDHSAGNVLKTPVNDSDIVNKKYVDDEVIKDHGNLTGLSDDDHTIYLKADGTRNLSGDLNCGDNDLYNVGSIFIGDSGTPSNDFEVKDLFKITSASEVGGGEVEDGSANNIFIGKNIAGSLTSGYNNLCFGMNVGTSLTSGYSNFCSGYNAGTALTSGYNNVLIGYKAGEDLTTGTNNVCLGSRAGEAITTGNWNFALGDESLILNTTKDGNTAIGRECLNRITDMNNVGVGFRAGRNMGAGGQNVFIGYDSGYGVSGSTAGWQNVIIGANAGKAITQARENILLGYEAGTNCTSAVRNIIIGYKNNANSATDDNKLIIGNLIFGTDISGTGTTISSGNIGIGIRAAAEKLHSSDKIRADGVFNHNGTDGITQTINITDNGGTTHTMVFSGGILTAYSTA